MSDDLVSCIEVEVLDALNHVCAAHMKPPSIVFGAASETYVEERYAEMRRLLKKPEWTSAKGDDGNIMRCLAVTEPDGDLILAYSPERNEYCVIQGCEPPYSTIGIWGDPVGCFVAM